MKKLILPFVAMVGMVFIMRWQGAALITPQSPRGILDLEFAGTAAKVNQLRLFLDHNDILTNIYLDFVFIAAYVWFFSMAATVIKKQNDWTRGGIVFVVLAFFAGHRWLSTR